MSKNLVIVGDSSFAEIAYEYFEKDSDYNVVAFAVEKEYRKRDSLFSIPVVDFETIEEKFNVNDTDVFVALTYARLNRVRTRICSDVKKKGYKLASYISSKSFVWDNVKIGENVFIFEDNTIQPFVEIGNNVIFWSGNHIGHHSVIGNNLFISSHVVVCGHCILKDNSFIGVNASIANNLTLEEDNFIALGSVIVKSTEKDSIYKGNPATRGKISAKKLCKV